MVTWTLYLIPVLAFLLGLLAGRLYGLNNWRFHKGG